MKRIIALVLLLIVMFSLCACTNEDYTKVTTYTDAIITEYYTAGGDLYQTVFVNTATQVSIITNYFWRYDDGREYLDRTEIIRINEKGEIVD